EGKRDRTYARTRGQPRTEANYLGTDTIGGNLEHASAERARHELLELLAETEVEHRDIGEPRTQTLPSRALVHGSIDAHLRPDVEPAKRGSGEIPRIDRQRVSGHVGKVVRGHGRRGDGDVFPAGAAVGRHED